MQSKILSSLRSMSQFLINGPGMIIDTNGPLFGAVLLNRSVLGDVRRSIFKT